MDRRAGALLARVSNAADSIDGLAARLVAIPSDSPAHDERGVIDALREAAVELGLPPGTIVAAVPERPNLVVSVHGRAPGPRLIWNGHADTKPPGERAAWPDDPWHPRLADGRLHGLGTADMKGGLAAMFHAASALVAEGLPARGELLLIVTADEEATGTLGLPYVLQATGLVSDAALIAEPAGIRNPFDTLHVGSRGFVGFRIVAHGRRLHSGLAGALGVSDAITALARAIDRLPELVDLGGPWPEPFSVGPFLRVATEVGGGLAAGIVPDVAWCRGEVRTVPGLDRRSVEAMLAAGLDRLRPNLPDGTTLDLEVDPEDWPASVVPASDPLVGALVRAATEVLGSRPTLGAFPGATEAHAFAARGIPCVPAFGPGLLGSAHVPAESIGLAELHAAAAIYALAAADFLG